jgi:hypothetical protein
VPRRKLDSTVKDCPGNQTSGIAPDSLATCKFKKVRLSGLPPARSDVEALMKSLEVRSASCHAPETAESRQISDGDALATVLAFSSHRK